MPTILLINDDGIQSIGLVALKRKLEKLGEVIVVAPEKERSGIGKALTTLDYIKIKETQLSDGSKAYAITGTPADAFLLAVNKILERPSWKDFVTFEELELTATLTQKVVEYVLKKGMPPDVDIISINVPETAKSMEAKLTDLSYKGYHDIYTKRKNGYKIGGWVLSGYADDKPGTDIHTIKKAASPLRPSR